MVLVPVYFRALTKKLRRSPVLWPPVPPALYILLCLTPAIPVLDNLFTSSSPVCPGLWPLLFLAYPPNHWGRPLCSPSLPFLPPTESCGLARLTPLPCGPSFHFILQSSLPISLVSKKSLSRTQSLLIDTYQARDVLFLVCLSGRVLA